MKRCLQKNNSDKADFRVEYKGRFSSQGEHNRRGGF